MRHQKDGDFANERIPQTLIDVRRLAKPCNMYTLAFIGSLSSMNAFAL